MHNQNKNVFKTNKKILENEEEENNKKYIQSK